MAGGIYYYRCAALLGMPSFSIYPGYEKYNRELFVGEAMAATEPIRRLSPPGQDPLATLAPKMGFRKAQFEGYRRRTAENTDKKA